MEQSPSDGIDLGLAIRDDRHSTENGVGPAQVLD